MSSPVPKTVSLLTTAVALTLVSHMTLFAVAVSAKPADSNSTGKATSVSNQSSSATSLTEQLKLTDQQKNEIRAIRSNRTKQINAVLTPDKKTKFEQARKSGKTLSQALNELKLKPDQKTKILAIAKISANNIKSKLTPDQLKQLDNYVKKQRGSVE